MVSDSAASAIRKVSPITNKLFKAVKFEDPFGIHYTRPKTEPSVPTVAGKPKPQVNQAAERRRQKRAGTLEDGKKLSGKENDEKTNTRIAALGA